MKRVFVLRHAKPLATLELPIDGWDALDDDTAELAGFVRPRDL